MNTLPDSVALYPLKFTPRYVSRIWGGNLLSKEFAREIPSSNEPIGESWELFDRPDGASVVAEGILAGYDLTTLVQNYGAELVGTSAQSFEHFPLMVKLIDAGQKLSLQVHPDREVALALGNGAEPKTEMWYVINGQADAVIMAGLNRRVTKQTLIEAIAEDNVGQYLQTYPSRRGDAYYIAAGTLHAIGGGNLLLEIQQNSDTTYRLSDWGRVDANGKSRQLHKPQAIASINYTSHALTRIAGTAGSVEFNRKISLVNYCPFFEVAELRLVSKWNDKTNGKSFHLLSAINSVFTIARDGEPSLLVNAGETVLVPANYRDYTITPKDSVECRIVKTTL